MTGVTPKYEFWAGNGRFKLYLLKIVKNTSKTTSWSKLEYLWMTATRRSSLFQNIHSLLPPPAAAKGKTGQERRDKNEIWDKNEISENRYQACYKKSKAIPRLLRLSSLNN